MPIIVVVASWLGNIDCTQPTESDGCTSDQFRVSARSRSTECPEVHIFCRVLTIIASYSYICYWLSKPFMLLCS